MTTALTPAVTPANLGALIEAQGETLAATVDQATEIFKQNQAEQKKTIDAQSKLIEELQAILIKERGEKVQLQKAHEAALKALNDKLVHKEKSLSDEIAQAQEICGKVVSLQDQSEVCCCFTHVKKNHQPPPTTYIPPYRNQTEYFAWFLRYHESECAVSYKGQEGGALRESTKTHVKHIQNRLEIIKSELEKK